MGDEVPRCIPWGAAPGVTPVTPPWLSARRGPSWLEEISSSEVDPGLGPSPGEFLGLRWWFERGVDGLGGPGSGLLRGTLPSCAEGHNQEIGTPLFCLGLPESQAGASSPHASSGGGARVPHLLSGILSDERVLCRGGICPVGTPCQSPSPSYEWYPRMRLCVRKCHLIWGD